MDSFNVAYASTRVPSYPVLAPQPLGFWGTFGWTAVALLTMTAGFVVAGIVAGFGYGVRLAILHEVRPAAALKMDDLFRQVTTDVALVGGLFVFFVTIILVCRRRGWRAIDYFALTKPQGRYARDGAAALVLALAMSAALSQFGVLGDYKAPSTISGLCIMLIGAVILAPIGEEMFFRGFLYRGFAAPPLGAAGAIVLTDLIWSAGHFDKPLLDLASIFFFGLLLGWLRWHTGSIIPTIAVHTLNNGIAGLAIAGVTLGWWTA